MESRFDFEWDNGKAEINLRKHGVAFEEAAAAFYDVNAKPYRDTKHSELEERFQMLAMSNRNRVLAVIYTRRGSDGIRLITARRATPRELQAYGKED